MSVSKEFRAELEFNPDISFKDAKKRYPTLSRSNFDFVKFQYRKDKAEELKKENPPPKKKTKKKTTPKTTSSTIARKVTLAQLNKMSIKNKLKLLGETAVDDFLLTGKETKILPKAMDLLSKEEFINQGDISHDVYWTSDTPPYKRPEFLYDHQQEAMALMDLSHILWEASRQLAGKTTATLLKDFEDMLDKRNTIVGLVAPTVPLAVELLMKFFYSVIEYKNQTYTFYEILKPYLLKDPNNNGFVLKNGSRLIIISLNQSGSQGRTLDIVHIEELDKLGSEEKKRQGLAGLINSIRKNPYAKIRICCNMPKGIFRLLVSLLFKYGHYFNIFMEDTYSREEEYSGRHSIINEDVIVEQVPVLDDFLAVFSEVLVSYAFAQSQLYNVDIVTDDTFNPDMVAIAIAKADLPDNHIYVKSTMGIDPGGKVDAFGVSIWSMAKNGEMVLRWTKRYYGGQHTTQFQAKDIAEQYIRYNCEYCQPESSAGAIWNVNLIADEVKKQSDGKITFRYEYVNFSGVGTEYDKNNFVVMFKILLDYQRIVLRNSNIEDKALNGQITLYIPNKSESNNNPDDLIESSFHAIWRLIGGFDYIRKLVSAQNAMIGATTSE